MCVCVCMHACDCGYTGTGVCTYVGMCVYMCQFMFSSFPHCWSYLIPHWSGRGFRTWYDCIGSALENSKGLHHTDFSVNGAPGSVQSTGLLSGLLPVGLAAGPTCLLRERLVPALPVKVHNVFCSGFPSCTPPTWADILPVTMDSSPKALHTPRLPTEPTHLCSCEYTSACLRALTLPFPHPSFPPHPPNLGGRQVGGSLRFPRIGPG